MQRSLTIASHWLSGIRQRLSPNHDVRPPGIEPELIVLHCISLPPGQFGGCYIESLFLNELDATAHPTFADLDGLRVSAHLLIRRDGSVTQFVPFDRVAWHAGVSCWRDRDGCNAFSVGIELEGADQTPYERVQYQVLAQVIEALRAAYPSLAGAEIVGHSDVAPGRKTDPGPAFDWLYFQQVLDEFDATR